MKLPEEVRKVERSLHADEEERLYEAIVRDCAKVCFKRSEDARKHGDVVLALAYERDGAIILDRYGLEPENRHD